MTSTFDDGAPAWATPRRQKNTTRSFVFQHADSGNCKKPKSQTCLRTAGYHQESRQRRAGQFPVLIRPLGIPRHRVAYRGQPVLPHPLSDQRPPEKSDIKPSALEVICKHCGMVARNSDFDIEQFVSKDGCGHAAFRTPHCDGGTHRNAAGKRRQTLVEVNRRPGSQQGSTENLILQY